MSTRQNSVGTDLDDELEEIHTKLDGFSHRIEQMEERILAATHRNDALCTRILNRTRASDPDANIYWVHPQPKNVFGVTTWKSLANLSSARLDSLGNHYGVTYSDGATKVDKFMELQHFLTLGPM